MSNIVRPNIEQWYTSKEYSDNFEVVAIEEDLDAIEIQFFNGELEELDFDSWGELHLMEIAEPEDWSGAYEMDIEDLSDYMQEIAHHDSWDRPLDFLESHGY